MGLHPELLTGESLPVHPLLSAPMLAPEVGPGEVTNQSIPHSWVVLEGREGNCSGREKALLVCWRRLCPNLMGEWRPHLQGVSDVTRAPEMGFSDSELKGVMVPDPHLFLS